MSELIVKNLNKSYGDRKILDNITFTLKSEFLVVFGPSGSGKTTLLRIIAGLIRPDNGEIFINNHLVTEKENLVKPYKRDLGFVFQSPALWPHMTIEQNILFGLKDISKIKAKALVEELLERLSISHIKGKYPEEISGGEAKRVALARTLAPKPSIILLDEPLSNIDINLKESLLDYILKMAEDEQMTLIYVTHDREEAKRVSSNWLKL